MLSRFIYAALLSATAILAQNATSPTPAGPATNATNTDAITTITGQGIDWTDKGDGTIVVHGQTLTPGDPETTISGYIVSAATEGIVLNGTTVSLPHPTAAATLTFTHETIIATEISEGVFEVYTATLTAGGSAQTVLGQEVSAGPNGLSVADYTLTGGSGTSDTDSGAGKVGLACSGGLVVVGLLFSVLL